MFNRMATSSTDYRRFMLRGITYVLCNLGFSEGMVGG
jgi:hypothetical protein